MTTKLNFKQALIAGLLAGLTAAAFNAALFLVFHAAGAISDTIYPQPNAPMTILPVIMASVIPAIIGSLVFFLFEKFTNKAYKIFSIVTIVLMVLSLYSPFTVIPDVTTSYALVLCAMHIVVPLTLLYFIRRAKQTNQIKHSHNYFQTA